MALREFIFKTASKANPLCRFTSQGDDRWILIHLFRSGARAFGGPALFLVHADPREAERFLSGEFGRRYGTFEVLHKEGMLTSVEVSRYVMPAYRGMDPVEIAIRFLGPEVIFEPILVHQGYIHIKVLAAQRTGQAFRQMTERLSVATDPGDFKLIHQGAWDPIRRLRPQDDELSPRQSETLRMAVDLGYYSRPRRCTLADLARTFGVSKAAVHKHLQAAESKIITSHAP